MNNSVKVVVGSAASFVAGYFIANWRNEKFYLDRANDEAEAIRAEFVDKLDAAEDRYEAAAAAASDAQNALRNLGTASDENDPKAVAEAAEALQTYQGKGGFEPVDVHAHAPVIQYSDYMTPEEPEAKTKDEKSSVEVLTSQEYMDNPMDYEDSTLVYYMENDVLAGGRADEGKVNETLRSQMLGSKDVLNRPGFWEKEEVWYFRNHALKYDFEVIREEGKYEDEESPGGDG